jgi:hypothetical protein
MVDATDFSTCAARDSDGSQTSATWSPLGVGCNFAKRDRTALEFVLDRESPAPGEEKP